jgi:hypothetical protein
VTVVAGYDVEPFGWIDADALEIAEISNDESIQSEGRARENDVGAQIRIGMTTAM